MRIHSLDLSRKAQRNKYSEADLVAWFSQLDPEFARVASLFIEAAFTTNHAISGITSKSLEAMGLPTGEVLELNAWISSQLAAALSNCEARGNCAGANNPAPKKMGNCFDRDPTADPGDVSQWLQDRKGSFPKAANYFRVFGPQGGGSTTSGSNLAIVASDLTMKAPRKKYTEMDVVAWLTSFDEDYKPLAAVFMKRRLLTNHALQGITAEVLASMGLKEGQVIELNGWIADQVTSGSRMHDALAACDVDTNVAAAACDVDTNVAAASCIAKNVVTESPCTRDPFEAGSWLETHGTEVPGMTKYLQPIVAEEISKQILGGQFSYESKSVTPKSGRGARRRDQLELGDMDNL